MKRSIRPAEKRKESAKVQRTTSNELKTAFAGLFLLQHERGMKASTFVKDLNSLGYNVSKATFNRWVAQQRSTGRVGVEEKKSGKPTALDVEQRNVLSGWVLTQENAHVETHLADYIEACSSIFKIDISKSTAQRYLVEDGFASKKMQNRTSGFKLSNESLVSLAWNWMETQHQRGLFNTPKHKVCSIDFTFTGHRQDRRTTYSRVGGAQPSSEKAVSNFTNCILTCVWMDGKNRTPPVLYTYNSKFRRDRKDTPRIRAEVEKLDECLKSLRLAKHRAVYIGTDSKEKRTYVPESSDLVRRFFKQYKIEPGCVIFSDNGKSFFDAGESVLTELGFQTHVAYPAAVHQFLSPNDNRLHGSSKTSWRALSPDYKDDVYSCLLLLNHLDCDIRAHSRTWFDRNMLCTSKEAVATLIGGGEPSNIDYFKQCLILYREKVGLDPRGDQSQIPNELQTELNGIAYSQ